VTILAKKEVISRNLLPPHIIGYTKKDTSLAEYEKKLILEVLKECNWNKHKAARRLSISRSTLYSKMKKYGLIKN